MLRLSLKLVACFVYFYKYRFLYQIYFAVVFPKMCSKSISCVQERQEPTCPRTTSHRYTVVWNILYSKGWKQMIKTYVIMTTYNCCRLVLLGSLIFNKLDCSWATLYTLAARSPLNFFFVETSTLWLRRWVKSNIIMNHTYFIHRFFIIVGIDSIYLSDIQAYYVTCACSWTHCSR